MICYAFFLFVSNDGDQISYLACWHPESSHCVRLCHLNLWDPWQTLTVLAPVSTRCQHQCLLPKQSCLKSLWYINILPACNNSHKYKEVKTQAALSFLKYSLYAFKIIYNGNSEMSFTTEDTGPGPSNRTHVHGCTQLCVSNVRTQKRLLFT